MVKAGNYQARVVDHDLMKNADGSIKNATVTFEFMDTEGKASRLTWFGNFNGGAAKITLETLMRLGFEMTSKEQLALLSRGQGEGQDLAPIYLNTEEDFEIVVEHNTYNGKTSPRIKYINEPGRASLKRMTPDEAKVLTGGLNIDADLAELLSKRQNAPKAPQAPTKKAPF